MRDKLIQKWKALSPQLRMDIIHVILHEKNNRITVANFTHGEADVDHFDLAIDLLQELIR